MQKVGHPTAMMDPVTMDRPTDGNQQQRPWTTTSIIAVRCRLKDQGERIWLLVVVGAQVTLRLRTNYTY